MKIEVNDIELSYVKEGVGKPLILLHGNGEDHTIFMPLTARLKEYFTVYALDSRNHGESSKTDDYSYETMAEDIYQFVQKMNLEEVSILGFSDGAIIAVLMELTHLGLFHRMALLGINLHPSDFKEDCLAYIKNEYEETKDPLMLLMLQQPDISLKSLSAIQTPTLVVRAEDELFRDSLYEEIVQTLPHAQLLIMEGHDHGSYIINSDALFENLFRLLVVK